MNRFCAFSRNDRHQGESRVAFMRIASPVSRAPVFIAGGLTPGCVLLRPGPGCGARFAGWGARSKRRKYQTLVRVFSTASRVCFVPVRRGSADPCYPAWDAPLIASHKVSAAPACARVFEPLVMWRKCGMGVLPMLARLPAFTAKLRFTGWEARATDHIATGSRVFGRFLNPLRGGCIFPARYV